MNRIDKMISMNQILGCVLFVLPQLQRIVNESWNEKGNPSKSMIKFCWKKYKMWEWVVNKILKTCLAVFPTLEMDNQIWLINLMTHSLFSQNV